MSKKNLQKSSISGQKRDLTRLLVRDINQSLRLADGVLEADLDAGAPVNTDGTVNLVHYAAWLVREMAADDD